MAKLNPMSLGVIVSLSFFALQGTKPAFAAQDGTSPRRQNTDTTARRRGGLLRTLTGAGTLLPNAFLGSAAVDAVAGHEFAQRYRLQSERQAQWAEARPEAQHQASTIAEAGRQGYRDGRMLSQFTGAAAGIGATYGLMGLNDMKRRRRRSSGGGDESVDRARGATEEVRSTLRYLHPSEAEVRLWQDAVPAADSVTASSPSSIAVLPPLSEHTEASYLSTSVEDDLVGNYMTPYNHNAGRCDRISI